jgi:hypothetical protein
MNTADSTPDLNCHCFRRPLRLQAAVLIGWALVSGAHAANYSARAVVDTAFEFSGVWSARVGYFDGVRQDEPGSVQIYGLIPGATFELILANPFHGVSVRLYDDVLTTGEALSFDGVWYGDGWGSEIERVEAFEYSVSGEYTFGGFNEPSEPMGTPTDSMWGYWDGTFSIRPVGLGTQVPEPGTGFAVLGLGAVLVSARRRRHA